MSVNIRANETAVVMDPLEVDVSHLVTEDDTPVDNLFSEKQMRLLTEPLHSSWAPGRDFVAMANVGLFFAVRNSAVVPDMLLSMDVQVPEDFWTKTGRSYMCWEYGKIPDLVVEIVSNREGGEASTKMDLYAKQNIPYYIIHDPQQLIQDDVLAVYEHAFRHYQRMTTPLFLEFGLQLVLWTGRYEDAEATWIRWAELDGTLIPTGAERAKAEAMRAKAEAMRANAETKRANAETERANAEAERANAEAEKAFRLAARLRAAGIDPDTV
jgi:Uma2 family endonuclease